MNSYKYLFFVLKTLLLCILGTRRISHLFSTARGIYPTPAPAGLRRGSFDGKDSPFLSAGRVRRRRMAAKAEAKGCKKGWKDGGTTHQERRRKEKNSSFSVPVSSSF